MAFGVYVKSEYKDTSRPINVFNDPNDPSKLVQIKNDDHKHYFPDPQASVPDVIRIKPSETGTTKLSWWIKVYPGGNEYEFNFSGEVSMFGPIAGQDYLGNYMKVQFKSPPTWVLSIKEPPGTITHTSQTTNVTIGDD